MCRCCMRWRGVFAAADVKEMLTHYAYFEFYALEYLGLGLSLDCCAVTGQTEGLTYVSPKTGKAVCREVGAPYHDRLFSYPHFVVDNRYDATYAEIFNVLKMTGFFLKEHFLSFTTCPCLWGARPCGVILTTRERSAPERTRTCCGMRRNEPAGADESLLQCAAECSRNGAACCDVWLDDGRRCCWRQRPGAGAVKLSRSVDCVRMI